MNCDKPTNNPTKRYCSKDCARAFKPKMDTYRYRHLDNHNEE